MTFGEKLLKLRKEKGLSQEALAEKVNTTRQAISKWENGQGFPETEKLLVLGNIFEVSIDYLLKDTNEENNSSDKGYYVSKEEAFGYLINESKTSKYIACGLSCLILSAIPYLAFKQLTTYFIISTIIMVTISVGLLITSGLVEDDRYKILKNEPLIFDQSFIKDLTAEYERRKRKYGLFVILGICFITAGVIPIFMVVKDLAYSKTIASYLPIGVVLIALGMFIFVRVVATMEAYELFIKNDEYTKKLSTKLFKKMKNKIERL